jgi:hypothetical protein
MVSRVFSAPIDLAMSSVLTDRFRGFLGVILVMLIGVPYIFFVTSSNEVRDLLLYFLCLFL